MHSNRIHSETKNATTRRYVHHITTSLALETSFWRILIVHIWKTNLHRCKFLTNYLTVPSHDFTSFVACVHLKSVQTSCGGLVHLQSKRRSILLMQWWMVCKVCSKIKQTDHYVSSDGATSTTVIYMIHGHRSAIWHVCWWKLSIFSYNYSICT